MLVSGDVGESELLERYSKAAYIWADYNDVTRGHPIFQVQSFCFLLTNSSRDMIAFLCHPVPCNL